MGFEGSNFLNIPTPEKHGVDRLQVKLRPAENKDYSYVTIDAGEGITFETVVKVDTAEIVDDISFTIPDRSGLGPRAKNLKQYVPEAVERALEQDSGFWTQPESVRLREAHELSEDRKDHLID